MRTFLLSALASAILLPATALAASPASAFDDARYPDVPRAATVAPQRDAVTPFDDAGVALPEVASPGPGAPALLAATNPYDDAGLYRDERAPAPDGGALRVADQAPAKGRCGCA